MKRADPLSHAGQTEPTSVELRGIEAAAIVHHGQRDCTSTIIKSDAKVIGVTVTQRVGNRFLRNTIERVFHKEGKADMCPIHSKIYVDRTTFSHAFDRVLQRVLKVRSLFQRLRPEHHDTAMGFGVTVPHHLEGQLEMPIQNNVALRDVVPGRLDLESHSCEALRQRIVHFVSHTGTLSHNRSKSRFHHPDSGDMCHPDNAKQHQAELKQVAGAPPGRPRNSVDVFRGAKQQCESA